MGVGLFGANLITFELVGLTKENVFLSTFLLISNSISGQPRHFNHDEIGRIGSDFDVWSAIRCARIRAFQWSANQSNATLLKVCEAIFMKIGAKTVGTVAGILGATRSPWDWNVADVGLERR